MIESETISFITNNGVAVGVLLWFMFRMERVIKSNTSAINKMSETISKCKR